MDILLSVVIPNYNGREHLASCLDHAQAALAQARFGHEIIVVDDASPDNSADAAESRPGVRLFRRDVNQGFGPTCNFGAHQARGRFIYLLNNDVKVDPDFWAALAPHMDNPDLFAVCSHAYDENGATVAGRNRPGFVAGFFKAVPDPAPPRDRAAPTIYASGGAAAFHRERFLAMGGFDPLYHPFYWEDFDLGYRAWKRGWTVMYEPRSRVMHKSHGVIRSANSEAYIGQINRRNQLIFNWKNITDAKYRAIHFSVLGLRTAANVARLRTYMLPILREVNALRPRIRQAQRAERPHLRRTDADIFSIFKD